MLINGKRLMIYFVIEDSYSNENAVSDEMQLAYMNALDWSLRPEWIKQKELSSIHNEKGNIFVFETFEEDFLEAILAANKNARIIGPRCLLTCFMELVSIPNTLSPIFNMSMNGLVITTSLVPVPKKELIKKLVGYMGGHYTGDLTTKTTHVVVNSLLNTKYFIACEKGISVLKYEWVEKVWEMSQKENIKATDYDIVKKYSCSIFYNLTITCSQLSEEKKSIIRKKIEKNGGIYSPDCIRNVTKILIIPFGQGEKFKYALRWKIKCLKPEWIDECLKKGYAVPFENFTVNSTGQASTPIRSGHLTKIPLNDTHETEISVIPSNNEKNIVNETESKLDILTIDKSLKINEANIFKTPSKSFSKETSSCGSPSENVLNYKKILDNIQINELKKCGPIFDGCKFYLAGFSSNEEEKLRKIFNYGGALRFTELNESITHIIVGNPRDINFHQIESIPNRPHVVKLEWLANSIKQKGLAKESSYLYNDIKENENINNSNPTEQPSPLSKKGYQILNPAATSKEENVSVPVVDHALIEKYSQSQNDGRTEQYQEKSKPISQAPSEQNQSSVSTSLMFAIVGHEAQVTEVIKNAIVEYGGTVVNNNRAVVDYTVVPMTYSRTKVASKEIVTSLWLEDCFFDMKVVEVKYYHQPVTLDSFITKPLNGCVITLSSYNPQEKQYLENITKFLGARYQDVLSKKLNPEKGVVPTTHLICACAQGSKYDAAKKWNLPIVKETWLCECFKNRTMLPIENYLLTLSKERAAIPLTSKKREVLSTKPISASFNPKPSNSGQSQNKLNFEGVPNFSTATTSTKIDDMQNSCKFDQISRNISVCQTNKINVNNHEVLSSRDSSSKISNISICNNNTNKKNDTSKAISKLSNGPTSFLLEMNASSERFVSGVKRKSDDHSNERKCRSPKKKVLCMEKHTLSPVEEIGWQDTLTDLSQGINPSCNRENIQPVKRNIMISVDSDKKQRFEAIVKELGGQVFSAYESDNSDGGKATHLVIDELKKTEKLLCSIASGLWIVHSSYLEKCHEHSEFIKEDDFEWGNPKNEKFLTSASNECKSMAAAAHRWRQIIKKGGLTKRPFVDMKAVIIGSSGAGNVHSLMKVVRSGGGQVLSQKEILQCTHCLLQSNNLVHNIPVPLETLIERKIHCLPAVYLKDFLIHDPPPDPKCCYVSEFKRLIKN